MILIVVPTILFLTSAELLHRGGTDLHASANPEVAEQGGPSNSTSEIIDNSTARILERTDTYIVADKSFAVTCLHSWYICRRLTTPMLQRLHERYTRTPAHQPDLSTGSRRQWFRLSPVYASDKEGTRSVIAIYCSSIAIDCNRNKLHEDTAIESLPYTYTATVRNLRVCHKCFPATALGREQLRFVWNASQFQYTK